MNIVLREEQRMLLILPAQHLVEIPGPSRLGIAVVSNTFFDVLQATVSIATTDKTVCV
jgi:hypothetical protein